MLPLQRLIVCRVAVTLVTEPGLADQVESWGGRALVLHEAPPITRLHTSKPVRAQAGGKRVFFATTFGHDDPVEAMIGAARLLPDAEITISGDFRRLPSLARAALEGLPHVEMTGWLDTREYLERMCAADVVVALTNDVHSVMRSAFEAAWFERPTVLSDTPPNREYFSPSQFAPHTASGLAAAIAAALAEIDLDALSARRRVLEDRWRAQREALLEYIGT
jgi:glycosyltransferase involved in cell wall biosynthesis